MILWCKMSLKGNIPVVFIATVLSACGFSKAFTEDYSDLLTTSTTDFPIESSTTSSTTSSWCFYENEYFPPGTVIAEKHKMFGGCNIGYKVFCDDKGHTVLEDMFECGWGFLSTASTKSDDLSGSVSDDESTSTTTSTSYPTTTSASYSTTTSTPSTSSTVAT